MKFPEISAQLLEKKLDNIRRTGASRVVMDCPGCIMQIRGGTEKRKYDFKVSHIAELLAENMKNRRFPPRACAHVRMAATCHVNPHSNAMR